MNRILRLIALWLIIPIYVFSQSNTYDCNCGFSKRGGLESNDNSFMHNIDATLTIGDYIFNGWPDYTLYYGEEAPDYTILTGSDYHFCEYLEGPVEVGAITSTEFSFGASSEMYINYLKIYDITNGGNSLVASVNGDGVTPSNKRDELSLTFSFNPEKIYRIEQKSTYKYFNHYSKDVITSTGTFTSFVCPKYKPEIETYAIGCNKFKIKVTNPIAGYEYLITEDYDGENPDWDPDFNYSRTSFQFSTNEQGEIIVNGDISPDLYFIQAYRSSIMNNTVVLDYVSDYNVINISGMPNPTTPIFTSPNYLCSCEDNSAVQLSVSDPGVEIYTVWEGLSPNGTWELIGSNLSLPLTDYESFINNGTYSKIRVKHTNQNGCSSVKEINPPTYLPCQNCNTNTFKPEPNQFYVLQAWVNEGKFLNHPSFEKAEIQITYLNNSNEVIGQDNFTANYTMVEGWQRLEHQFRIPNNTVKLKLAFINNSNSNDVYFDDIRIFKAKGEMVTYVYNQETMQLEYELDRNNYYKRYIRNQSGEIEKVNVETSQGIRTVVETRSHIQKK